MPTLSKTNTGGFVVSTLICSDCGCGMDEPHEEGEITSCQVCGYEVIMEKGKIIPLQIEGEDWGE